MSSAEAAVLLATLQLADSAFPIGGFVLSHGLETAVHEGRVRSLDQVEAYLGAVLLGGLSGLDLPVLLSAHRLAGDQEDVERWDRALLARKPAREPREASRRVGRALLRAAAVLTDDPRVVSYMRAVEADQAPGLHPVVHGLVAAALGIDGDTALLVFAHSFLLGGLSAALRLLSIDHLAAQAALVRLRPAILRAAARAHAVAATGDPDALSGFAPMAELFAMRHERGDARAFAT